MDADTRPELLSIAAAILLGVALAVGIAIATPRQPEPFEPQAVANRPLSLTR